MGKTDYATICEKHLKKLCGEIDDRSVGTPGNRDATLYYASELESSGWEVDITEFSALDWESNGTELTFGDASYEVFSSPYSEGCNITAELIAASTVEELNAQEIRGKIVLLHGDIAKEQLMPKGFVFYNPEEHKQIISLLEKDAPSALVCATGRNAALAGGVYPFPLIEDGDFDIPSVYTTDVNGSKILDHTGQHAHLVSKARRIPSKGQNIIGRKGPIDASRVVVSAHIDAKKGTPGAIDNGTGVAVLLLLAEMLGDYHGAAQIELAAFNGEDYYSVPGQMAYLAENEGRFNTIALNINIDGAGYYEGESAFSFYDLPDAIEEKASHIITHYEGIILGAQWYQGDHSIFIQQGCPAIAVSSAWFTENIDSQDITHTPKDNLDIVDSDRVVEIAKALDELIRMLG